METVHDTDVVFEAAAESGIRATIGKCLMDAAAEDAGAAAGNGARVARRKPRAARSGGTARGGGRLRAAFAPRFAVSCSRDLLEAVAGLSAEAQRPRSHARVGVARRDRHRARAVRRHVEHRVSGRLRLASPRLCTAHCVWVDDREQVLLAEHDVKVMHCPSSNLKLGSGIAPVAEMRAAGITVSLGADGAACNNRLDMFEEMRLAALLQATRHGPGALTARDALGMATRAGASTLGLEHEIGSIEAGQARRRDRRRPRSTASARPAPIRTRRSSMRLARPTCARPSSTATCSWMSSRRREWTRRKSRPSASAAARELAARARV